MFKHSSVFLGLAFVFLCYLAKKKSVRAFVMASGFNLSEKLILRRSKVKGKRNHTLTLINPLLVLNNHTSVNLL